MAVRKGACRGQQGHQLVTTYLDRGESSSSMQEVVYQMRTRTLTGEMDLVRVAWKVNRAPPSRTYRQTSVCSSVSILAPARHP